MVALPPAPALLSIDLYHFTSAKTPLYLQGIVFWKGRATEKLNKAGVRNTSDLFQVLALLHGHKSLTFETKTTEAAVGLFSGSKIPG